MKRKTGHKAIVLFDNIDYLILAILQEKSVNIMELCKEVKMRHNNLKLHIDRLIILGLISYIDGKLYLEDNLTSIKMDEFIKTLGKYLKFRERRDILDLRLRKAEE